MNLHAEFEAEDKASYFRGWFGGVDIHGYEI